MSPEQAAGQPLDARSDIFSFGAVVYEMLSGNRAFRGTTTPEVLSAVLRDQPPPLRPSSTLSSIVQKCLAKEPGQRYQTMDEVQAALAQAVTTPVKEAPSIAVLPFASLRADAENEFFSDGISEEIINALGQIAGLRVAARSSSFSFKGKSIARLRACSGRPPLRRHPRSVQLARTHRAMSGYGRRPTITRPRSCDRDRCVTVWEA